MKKRKRRSVNHSVSMPFDSLEFQRFWVQQRIKEFCAFPLDEKPVFLGWAWHKWVLHRGCVGIAEALIDWNDNLPESHRIIRQNAMGKYTIDVYLWESFVVKLKGHKLQEGGVYKLWVQANGDRYMKSCTITTRNIAPQSSRFNVSHKVKV